MSSLVSLNLARIMADITDRKDIEHLVDSFYNKVLKDEIIGPFFTEVVALDLKRHMPVMYAFWEGVLFGKTAYRGNPMVKHIALSRKCTLRDVHFERWLSLWKTTVNNNFQGPMAEEAVNRAIQIGELMKFKIRQDETWSTEDT